MVNATHYLNHSVVLTHDEAQTVAFYVCFALLAVAAVLVRLLVRLKRTKSPLAADDYFAFLACFTLIPYAGVSAASYYTATVDLSRLHDVITLQTLSAKVYYFANIIFPWPITAAKLSILFLYRRLFGVKKRFMTVVYVTMVLCVMWWLATFLLYVMICIPPSRYWDLDEAGSCTNEVNAYLGMQFPNTILDFWVVILPIWEIRHLQLQLQHKISIACIFLLSSSVGAIGIYRIVQEYQQANQQNFLQQHFPRSRASYYPEWSMIQDSVAILCCCLPTYGPLLPRKMSLTKRIRSWWSSFSDRKTVSSEPSLLTDGRHTMEHSRASGTVERARELSQDVGTEIIPHLESGTAQIQSGSWLAVPGRESVVESAVQDRLVARAEVVNSSPSGNEKALSSQPDLRTYIYA